MNMEPRNEPMERAARRAFERMGDRGPTDDGLTDREIDLGVAHWLLTETRRLVKEEMAMLVPVATTVNMRDWRDIGRKVIVPYGSAGVAFAIIQQVLDIARIYLLRSA